MIPPLKEAVIQVATACYMRFLAESVAATDRVGRAHGVDPLCSPEEEDFLAETTTSLSAGWLPPIDALARLQALFERGAGAPYPTLGDVNRLQEAAQLVGLITADP